MTDPLTITLAAPIKAHGADVSTLTLRPPGGKDVRELGFPFKLMTDESIVMQTEIVAHYITRLAGVPMSSVDQLDPSDFNMLAWAVTGFFLKSAAATATS